jgi:hypothetical protein
MATRRNRIKAVINVPRGRPAPAPASPAHGTDRPLTPISSNVSGGGGDPSSPLGMAPASPSYYHHSHYHSPSSPVKSFLEKEGASPSRSPGSPAAAAGRGKSPSTVQLPPSSSLLRSPSPSTSRLLNQNHPAAAVSTQALANKSPSHSSPFHPPMRSPPYHPNYYRDASPEKRPPPALSPFRPLGSPATPPPPPPQATSNSRPSPARSPGFAFPSPVAHPSFFSTNSNSADSHEVAR